MKIFLTGKNGQLGYQLEYDLKKSYEVVATDRKTLDLRETQVIEDVIHKIKPDLIINAAAYTDVNKAEKEKYLAYKINALAPRALTNVAEELDIAIIHISTDYIFDGLKKDAYKEEDYVNPLSIYAKTKWQGEEIIRQYPKHFILRTGWIFSSHGSNFLKTIINLAQKKTSLDIVDDQWGVPTSVKTLSAAIQVVIKYLERKNYLNFYGTYHVVSEGQTNWYLYANKILDILISYKIKLKLKKNNIRPISSLYNSDASIRPKNSRMNTEKFKNVFKFEFPYWENEVEDTINQIINEL